jgi:hypothetical protein
MASTATLVTRTAEELTDLQERVGRVFEGETRLIAMAVLAVELDRHIDDALSVVRHIDDTCVAAKVPDVMALMKAALGPFVGTLLKAAVSGIPQEHKVN